MENIILYTNGCLGDELNLDRNMIFDLYYNKFISNTIIIYCHEDRTFLYETIFTNIVTHKECDIKNINKYVFNNYKKNCILIKISEILLFPGIPMSKYGYDNMLNINIRVTKDNILNYNKINYYNNNYPIEFKNLVTNANFLEKLPAFNECKFIVYHHRYKNDNAWDQTIDKLNVILKLKDKYNIVIFSKHDFSNLNSEKIYYTNNLKEYASFVNSKNNIALISVWSGGSQLGSYFNNTKVITYFHKIQSQHNYLLLNGNMNKYINSENGFDFCHFSSSNRIFINETEFEEIEKFL